MSTITEQFEADAERASASEFATIRREGKIVPVAAPLPRSSERIPVDDGSRHVLIIEENGVCYVAPHPMRHDHPMTECVRVGDAVKVFRGGTQMITGPNPGPGRFWIAVDDHGVLEIGGRVDA